MTKETKTKENEMKPENKNVVRANESVLSVGRKLFLNLKRTKNEAEAKIIDYNLMGLTLYLAEQTRTVLQNLYFIFLGHLGAEHVELRADDIKLKFLLEEEKKYNESGLDLYNMWFYLFSGEVEKYKESCFQSTSFEKYKESCFQSTSFEKLIRLIHNSLYLIPEKDFGSYMFEFTEETLDENVKYKYKFDIFSAIANLDEFLQNNQESWAQDLVDPLARPDNEMNDFQREQLEKAFEAEYDEHDEYQEESNVEQQGTIVRCPNCSHAMFQI